MAKHRQRRADPEVERRWRQRISAWATSGLTARAYCRDHGVSEASFYSWRRKLRQRDGAGELGRVRRSRSKPTSRCGAPDAGGTPTFVPVTLVGGPTDVQADGQPASIEVVHASGTTVRINSKLDTGVLAAVFAALDRASSC